MSTSGGRDQATIRILRTLAKRIVADTSPWERGLLRDCASLLGDDTRLQLFQLGRSRHDSRGLVLTSWFDEPFILRPNSRAHPIFADAARHPAIRTLAPGRDATVRLSDVVDLPRFRDSETFRAVHPRDARYLGACRLARDAGGLTFLGLERTRRDFGDGDLRAMEMLTRIVGPALRLRHRIDALDLVHEAGRENAHECPVGAAGETSDYWPTTRQQEVLDLLAEGLTSRQVGRRLGITERGVRKHLQVIYAGTRSPNRAAAAAWWRERSL